MLHRASNRSKGPEQIRFRAESYPVDVALELERETGLSRPVAAVLARRGLRTPAEVTAFLNAEESHDPFDFESMASVATGLLESIRSRRRITVYGDFDCDGVCATSILVGAIRELGGDCDWFIPDRIGDGYGLNPDAIRRIADRGTSLVITVDCGVTAVAEVALAKELGMEIVVTDHHQFDPVLPDCPILHPVVSRYPFPSLCGAAVAAKLASALRREAGADTAGDEADLDLVALATVADVMPLTGENRHLVRDGVKVARRARRVGLAALMAETRIEPSRIDSEDFGYRLGPRINAAGRMYRADAGVELFLAESKERAEEIARELSAANAERRRVEQEVETAAKAELRSQDESGPALVVAGEGWHPGVVGIVASKLVKATGRPSVVIAIDGESARGSARSVPGLDLHAAIGETADLLEAFGGHAAAAGLSIRPERIDDFRTALGSAVDRQIGGAPVERFIVFDAVAGGSDLGLDLAEELDQLQPFGQGNPSVKVLIPGARIEDIREMGEGKHCRFSICSGSHRAKAVCFGRTDFGLEKGQQVDVIAELGVNHWNGSIEPQLRVEEISPIEETAELENCEAAEWWDRFEMALKGSFEPVAIDGNGTIDLASTSSGLPGVSIGELISSGERLVIVTADAQSRWTGLGGSALARFIPNPIGNPREEADAREDVAGIWAGSPVWSAQTASQAQVLVTDFATLAGPVAPSIAGFDRIALLDPPYTAEAFHVLNEARLPVHFMGGADESVFAARVAAHRLDLTGQLRGIFRGFRTAGAIDGTTISGEELRELLEADGRHSRSPEESAVLMRVLIETGLARTSGIGSARVAGVVSSERTELSSSAVFAHHFELHKEQDRFLNHFNRPTHKP